MSEITQDDVAKLLGVSAARVRVLCDRNLIAAPTHFLSPSFPYWDSAAFDDKLPLRREGHIYFIGMPGFIKIGFTGSVESRLRGLRTASPLELSLLHSTKGTLAREGEIIDAFADLHHRGEWFRDEAPLAEFVGRLKKRGDRPGERIRPQ